MKSLKHCFDITQHETLYSLQFVDRGRVRITSHPREKGQKACFLLSFNQCRSLFMKELTKKAGFLF